MQKSMLNLLITPSIPGLQLLMSIAVASSMLAFFPNKKIAQVDLPKIQKRLITLFKSKGMPQCIRVDNGLPLEVPARILSQSFHYGLFRSGINMIWNRPSRPRDNAKVERAQRTLRDWAEPSRWHDPAQLQEAINRAIETHNQYYQVSRLGGQTRAQVYPKLLKHTGNRYQKRQASFRLVLEALAKRTWKRKVAKSGQVYIFNQRFMVGKTLQIST
ncbi:MAG: integrase core domain-containing protein [Bacteroidia bacterium]